MSNTAKKILELPKDLPFSRSLGWLSQEDLEKLKNTHVGILGVGGVGGQYAEIVARLGVGEFTIYDPDVFSIENTNRQNECKRSNYGKSKAEVIGALILDINPEAKVRIIPRAMDEASLDAFCQSIDIYMDGLDFFAIDIRIATFRKLREYGKPAITVAPLGAGGAALVFNKDSMSFDDYFGLHTTDDPVVRSRLFVVGLAPSLMQAKYLKGKDRVDFDKKTAPSLPLGVYTCATMAATLLMKIVLSHGPVMTAPRSIHFDPYLNKLKTAWVWWGYRNPIQRLRMAILKYVLRRTTDVK